MENTDIKKTSSFSFTLTNGIVLGVILVIYSLILYFLDFNRDNTFQYFSYVFVAIVQFMVLKNYRDKFNNGFISYGKGFSMAFLVSLWASIILAIYVFVFFSYIAPDEIQEMISEAREAIYDKYPDWEESQVDTAMSYSAAFMKPPVMASMTLVFNLLFSTVVALIVSAFTKKDAPESKF